MLLHLFYIQIFHLNLSILLPLINGSMKVLLNEKSIQPIYYPSINKENLDDFQNKFYKEFNEKPNHLSLLSYDLVGLVYYLSLNNDLTKIDSLFKKKKFI